MDAHKKESTRLFNLLALVSGVSGILIAVLAYVLDQANNYYYFLVPTISCLYFSVLFFNARGASTISWYLICLGSPIWQGIADLVLGGNFSQSAAFLVSLAIAYTVFDKEPKLRNLIIFLQLAIYSLFTIYIFRYGTIFEPVDPPLDEYFVFFGSLGWLYFVIFNFVTERRLLIRDLKLKNKELRR